MKDRSSIIFGNPIDKKTLKKAEKSKAKFIKRFGDDSKKEYHLALKPIPCLSHMGVSELVASDKPFQWSEKAVVVGNIRMGFGHYRISMAIASCAKAMGYEPYWFNLAGFEATGSKMIRYQNDLYSLASRISSKSKLFNALIWEPLNSEGFRKLTYNAADQKNSELLVPLFADFPKDVPYVATHVWPSQGAVHAGLTHVVNAIPDNWPMALHLSEGAIHTVQTPFAYLGYKMMNGFAKTPLKGMDDDSLFEVGHYVDHELVANLEEDTKSRLERIDSDKPLRLLFSVGGAGAGAKSLLESLKKLSPYIKEGKIAVFLNFGDHKNVYEYLCKKDAELMKDCHKFFDEYGKIEELVKELRTADAKGIYCFYNSDIFEAVYSSNLLMRVSDILLTKPSELSFYPIPKIFTKHIGGHEAYGAIHGAEYGDGSFEVPEVKSQHEMTVRLISDKELLRHINRNILKLKSEGLYDGGYKAVELAVKGKE